MDRESFLVAPDSGTIRLDQFLGSRTNVYSRTRARWLIDLGAVYVNGIRVRVASRLVRPSDRIDVHSVDPAGLTVYRVAPEDLILEDQDIIGLNKPSGVNSQPTRAQYKGCVYEAVVSYLRERKSRLSRGVGLPQRLDREVSGVMVLSCSERAHKALTETFKHRQVRKTYLALCHGEDYQGDIQGHVEGSIGRLGGRGQRALVAEGGKPALTRFRIAGVSKGACLVEVEPVTGRTHQIRIHLAGIGLPILGDRMYGTGAGLCGSPDPGLMLHAWSLAFPHPVTKTELTLRAGIPNRMTLFGLNLGLVMPTGFPAPKP